MRILLIRHGDPDYEHDTLTEKGRREAELLAKRASCLRWEVVISLPWQGDGYGTACLKATGKDAEVLEWLREFPAQLDLNKDPELSRAYPGAKMADGKYLIRNVWDMAPGYWTEHEEYMDRREWRNSKVAECSDMEVVYDRVIREFDAFLAEHGYVRERNHYRVEKESTETVTFFLSFCDQLCIIIPFVECFPVCIMAWAGACTDFCDRGGNGRERAGNCVFPRYKSRRYFPFICREGKNRLLLPVSVKYTAMRIRDIRGVCLWNRRKSRIINFMEDSGMRSKGF